MKLSLRSFVYPVVFLACSGMLAFQATAQDDSGDGNNADANIARLQVKISELEDQIRTLRGSIEQVQYQNQQLKDQIAKTNTDTQYRLDALEKKAAAVSQPAAPASGGDNGNANTQQPDSGKLVPVESPDNSEDTSSVPHFATSREHYNYAFRLLNQSKYKEAGAAFAAFTKAYPKDPLIGNAWYWLGETYYVQRDYVRAADDFRQGYESMSTGPKAPDNLLKLAMSLNNLKKDKEACIILKQVVVKFGSSSKSMRTRAEQEMNTIGCEQ